MSRFLIVFFLLFLMLEIPMVYGEEVQAKWFREQWSASGAEDLLNMLPEESRDFLSSIGITDPTENGLYELNFANFAVEVSALLYAAAQSAVQQAGPMIGIILLSALLESLHPISNGIYMYRVFRVAAILFCALLLVVPLGEMMRDAEKTLTVINGFQVGFVPIFGGITAAAGQIASAGKYTAVTLAAAQGGNFLLTGVVLPLLRICTAFTITTSAAATVRLDGLLQSVFKVIHFILSALAAIFLAVLSLQSVIGGAADSVSDKTVQFLLGSSVPVVGNALSQAYTSVRSSVQLLKSTVGVFGILAAVVTGLPQLIQFFVWRLLLELCAALGNLMGQSEIVCLLRNVSAILGLLLGSVLFASMLPILSTGILLAIRTA